MAGYSATPLSKKLGIKQGMKVLLIDAPEQYSSWLGGDITYHVVKSGKDAELVHVFAKTKGSFEMHFNSLIKELAPSTAIWVSWYKKSSGIITDVTEDIIRKIVFPAGWVDIKVCAVSDDWSGLKVVKRKKLR